MSHNTLPTDKDVSELLKLSRVHNTDKCMAKWLRTVDRYREVSSYEKLFESIPEVIELESFLCKFLVWLKRIDEKEYKAESIHNCYASLARYLKENSVIKPCNLWDSYKFGKALRTLDGKMKKLQKEGFGEIDQSAALTVDEIFIS